MREARIHVLEPTADEARAALGRLFPSPGAYVLKAPTGRRVALTIHGHAAHAGDPLTLWRTFFPDVGRYELHAAPEFAKAVALTPDKVFEEWFLEDLVDRAQVQAGSIRALIRRVVADFIGSHGGDLTNPAQLQRFETLLFDLRQGIRWAIGNPVTPAVERALRGLGFTDRDLLDWPGLSYRLGMIDAELRATGRFAWPRVLELAARVPLLHSDEVAMAVARHSAGQYLTPALLRDGTRMHAAALAREREMLRTMTAEAVAKEMHPRAFARELYTALGKDEGIQRDWERVARTEIAEARLRGAFEGERRARNWRADTVLYKMLAANPCSGCLRLWRNPDGTPFLITVQQLEAEDARGPNTGPWREWHHRIGPSHPNCRDSPALTYVPTLVGLFQKQAESWKALMRARGLAA